MAPRVLAVYGSENNRARTACKNLVAEFKGADSKFTIDTKFIDGNTAAEKLATLKDDYDLLVVLCSSYGEGEPTDNFRELTAALFSARREGEKPLEGVQHAVLGYGDEFYTYFMNNPRMTDKLLEDCGSRRFHVRGEVNNAAQGSNGAKDCYEVEKDWIQSCYKALNAGPKVTDKPAELGTGPYADRENEIEDDLRDSASGGGMSTGTIIAAVIAFIIAVVVAKMQGLLG